MKKENMQALDYLLETLAIVGLVVYIGMQIIYFASNGSSVYAIAYRVITMVLLYMAALVAEIHPEMINVGSSEPLTGKVRFYACRMLRWAKLIFVFILLIPAIADVVEYPVDEAYSLIAVLLILIDICFYMYKIYKYNKEHDHKGK